MSLWYVWCRHDGEDDDIFVSAYDKQDAMAAFFELGLDAVIVDVRKVADYGYHAE